MTVTEAYKRGLTMEALALLCTAVAVRGLGQPPPSPSPDARPQHAQSPPTRVIARLGTDRFRRPNEFSSVAYSPDGLTLATASRHEAVHLWNATDGNERTPLQAEDGASVVAFSPDGKWLAAAGDHTRIWWLRKGHAPQLAFTDYGANALAFSADGKLLARGHNRGVSVLDMAAYSVFETAPCKELFNITAERGVGAVAFSPDGKLLASAADIEAEKSIPGDPVIRLREALTGKAVGTLDGHKGCILSVAFAPDGKTLVSSSLDGSIRIWDVAKREMVRQIPASADRIALSPDGKIIATFGCSVLSATLL